MGAGIFEPSDLESEIRHAALTKPKSPASLHIK